MPASLNSAECSLHTYKIHHHLQIILQLLTLEAIFSLRDAVPSCLSRLLTTQPTSTVRCARYISDTNCPPATILTVEVHQARENKVKVVVKMLAKFFHSARKMTASRMRV
jgi:hypothetical protein